MRQPLSGKSSTFRSSSSLLPISLGLAYNSFATPEIPPQFGYRIVGFEFQQFGRRIPSGLFLLRNLSDLFLYKNNLSGQIPPVIESLNLIQIDLAMNMLKGSTPEDFGKLQQLEVLNLNNFSRELLSQLGIHSKLEAFEKKSSSYPPTAIPKLSSVHLLPPSGLFLSLDRIFPSVNLPIFTSIAH
ncbi:hypothetical protein L6452_24207 [Arctium lappa]|uniref:Uncharacterized protein n=1 Tax=Arctium lappa TaxID=4217 RepID=A0ACB9A8E1_ARCLA|nr:hypothetical protein L6452_24207 [Arctium lappa]